MTEIFKKDLSYSSMGTLMECPYKFYLRYKEGWYPKKDKVALAFGDAMDKAVGHSLSSMHGDAVARFRKIWVELKDSKTIEFTEKNNWKKMMETGEELCKLFEENERDKFEEVIAIQKNLKGQEDPNGIHIISFADVIAKVEGKITLIDVKTSAGAHYWKAKDVRTDPQLSLYYGLAAANNIHVDQVAFLVAFKDKPRWQWEFAPRCEDHVEEMREQVSFCKGVMNNGIYPKNWGSCDKFGGCEYSPICRGLAESTIKTTLKKTDKKPKKNNEEIKA